MKLYTLKEGYEYNPLKKYRNLKCPCGSDLKVKKCHGVFEALPTDVAEKVKMWCVAVELMKLKDEEKNQD